VLESTRRIGNERASVDVLDEAKLDLAVCGPDFVEALQTELCHPPHAVGELQLPNMTDFPLNAGAGRAELHASRRVAANSSGAEPSALQGGTWFAIPSRLRGVRPRIPCGERGF
jgi:hypothetical protein